MKQFHFLIIATLLICPWFVKPLGAEVKDSAADGFQISLQVETSASNEQAFAALTKDFSSWWDASHSYSQKASTLSMDLTRNCMLEKLPQGGFVRHMEIVFYQPNQQLRLSGGLGPLQEMGVSGCLTFKFVETENGTKIQLSYSVTGRASQKLDKIAAPVDGVLKGQLERLKNHCDKLKK